MPFPKISAILNNCGLHALTPEIKAEIAKFAAEEGYDNHHKPAYLLFKQAFEKVYGFPRDSLTWVKLSNLLEHYNPFDTQLILGPVLREFIKTSITDDALSFMVAAQPEAPPSERKNQADFLKQYTELGNNSRYYGLDPQEIAQFASIPLGFTLSSCAQDQLVPTIRDAENPIGTIAIYFSGNPDGPQSGGHWERTVDEEPIDSQHDAKLNCFQPLLGDNPHSTQCANWLIRKHIQFTAQANADGADHTVDFADITLSALQISQYIESRNFLSESTAVKLLGPYLTADAKAFIRNYVPQGGLPHPDYETYIEHPNRRDGIIARLEMQQKEAEDAYLARQALNPGRAMTPLANAVEGFRNTITKLTTAPRLDGPVEVIYTAHRDALKHREFLAFQSRLAPLAILADEPDIEPPVLPKREELAAAWRIPPVDSSRGAAQPSRVRGELGASGQQRARAPSHRQAKHGNQHSRVKNRFIDKEDLIDIPNSAEQLVDDNNYCFLLDLAGYLAGIVSFTSTLLAILVLTAAIPVIAPVSVGLTTVAIGVGAAAASYGLFNAHKKNPARQDDGVSYDALGDNFLGQSR